MRWQGSVTSGHREVGLAPMNGERGHLVGGRTDKQMKKNEKVRMERGHPTEALLPLFRVFATVSGDF